MKNPPVEWDAEGDVKGRPLDPHELKAARQKDIQYLWDRKLYEYATEVEAPARTGRNTVGLKWIDTNKGSAEAPRYRTRLVCTEEVRHQGAEPIFSAFTALGNSASFTLCCVKKTFYASKTPS